ncbi:uncharacterized protein YyaL (SSP411 family) [Microbacterium resistens]|uniref:Uncharacterized protein YyaL (SSP411 family) n=1 Tax=Microbacterium resistens TaxID=156977 RepID=A0ABU1S7Z3_9MICO|nr:DUF255 domain-containing protein [Microbacterium resistens]MDR6865730.1 uncharacterized protein YyaL (SSP411 family) [Microbacterium resistens]
MANRLADTLSPYLRAHADNPVDWYPWGEEAFAEARRRDLPVMISIGYSTCHWCHVMARESFADPVTAAALNDGFIAVKVDREEHPDVDAAYLAAASAFTQDLGWPLTVFATPEGRAFHAGTYWPPVGRPPLPAFRDVLAAVREAWTARRDEVDDSAARLAAALARASTAGQERADVGEDGQEREGALPTAEALAEAAARIAEREDTRFGGFGGAPKFPVATTLGFLLHPLLRETAPDAASSAERALAAMASSPLRDGVDGGFFRYATQRDWTVPHFERMLTDNAQLLDIALVAGDTAVARGIAAFLLRTLGVPGGGFRAAQDSESWIDGRRSEGGYYALPAEGRALLAPPAVDGKVITGWNGLAIGALARAGSALREPDWIRAAEDAARAVLAVNRDAHGALVRSSLEGVAADAVATRADLGLLADGLFALALAAGDADWAVAARDVLDAGLAGVGPDPVLVAQGIVASPDESDGDLPSGTAALATAARTAWLLGAGEEYRTAAEGLVAGLGDRALAQPFAHGALLRAAAGLVRPPRQIVVVTEAPDGALADAARRADADVVAVVGRRGARAFADAGFTLFEGRDGDAGLAYDCRAFVCRLPVREPSDLAPDR